MTRVLQTWRRRLAGIPAWMRVSVLVVVVGSLAYRGSFDVPFVFDDEPNLLQNARIRITDLGVSSVARAVTGNPNGRPVAFGSFALNYYAGGYSVFGYHVVNFAIHCINALLVFLLGVRLLSLATPKAASPTNERIATIAALLFLAHPVQVQAVTYVVQRMTSLGATFALASVLLYLQARSRRGNKRVAYGAAAVLGWLGAFGCKQTYIVVPALIAALEVVLFPGWLDRLRRRPVLAAVLAVSFLAGTVLVLARYWAVIEAGYSTRDFTMAERLLTEPRVVVHYVTLVLLPLPSRLPLYYDYPVSSSLFSPATTVVAIAGLLLATILAVRYRRTAPLVAIAVLWFLLALSIESSILPLELAFNHRIYFPCIALLLLLACLIARLAGFLRLHPWLIAAPLIAALAAGSAIRNEIMSDPLRLHQEAAEASPRHARAHLNVGTEHYERGNTELARSSFETALELDPALALAVNNLGNLARDAGELGRAEQLYRRALQLHIQGVEPLLSLAWISARQGRLDEAESYLNDAIRTSPDDARAYVNLGAIEIARGKPRPACQHLDRAVHLDPRDPVAHAFRGDCLAALGRTADAREAYRAALRFDPSNEQARAGLARTEVRQR